MTLTVTYDIPYGNNFRQRVDLLVPTNDVSGVVFYFHGGGWQSGSKSSSGYVNTLPYDDENIARSLASAGFIVVNCNTRLASDNNIWNSNEEGKWPNNVNDVETILRFGTVKDAGINFSPTWNSIYNYVQTNGFTVAGFDSGGHLAVLGAGNYGNASKIWPRAVINICGPLDLFLNPPNASGTNAVANGRLIDDISAYITNNSNVKTASPFWRLGTAALPGPWYANVAASTTRFISIVNSFDTYLPPSIISSFHTNLPSAQSHLITVSENAGLANNHNLTTSIISPLVNINYAVFNSISLPTSINTITLPTQLPQPTFTAPDLGEVEVLIVGGGGAGSQDEGGGGGGGGVVYHQSYKFLPGTAINLKIGRGGLRPVTPETQGIGTLADGKESSFGSLRAFGGGAGAGSSSSRTAGNGGSGGGGGSALAAGQGSLGQGFGGASTVSGVGGGGGGAGGPGLSNGNGGIGFESNITGTPTYYGGGGAGTSITNVSGTGGLGGGGTNTGFQASSNNGQNNLGGGGAAYSGDWGGAGNGGSGVVIVAYPIPQRATGGNVTIVGNKVLHRFTTVGEYRFLPDYSNPLDSPSFNQTSSKIECEPIALSEYYANDVYVRKGTDGFPKNIRTPIPDLAEISVINFYGASAGFYTIVAKDEFGANTISFINDQIIRFDISSIKDFETLYFVIENQTIATTSTTTGGTTSTTTTAGPTVYNPTIIPVTTPGAFTIPTLNVLQVSVINGPPGEVFSYRISGPEGSLTNGTGIYQSPQLTLNAQGQSPLTDRIFTIMGEYVYTFTFANFIRNSIISGSNKRFYTVTVSSGYYLTGSGPISAVRNTPILVTVNGAPGDIIDFVGPTSGSIQLSNPLSGYGSAIFDISLELPLDPGVKQWTLNGKTSLGTYAFSTLVVTDLLPPSAIVTVNKDYVAEGESVTFSVTVSGLASDASVYYLIEPTNQTSTLLPSDIEQIAAYTNITSFELTAGSRYTLKLSDSKGQVIVKIKTDLILENVEFFRLRFYLNPYDYLDNNTPSTGITSTTIIPSPTPTPITFPWSLTASKTSVTEGEKFTVTLVTGTDAASVADFELTANVGGGQILFNNSNNTSNGATKTEFKSGKASKTVDVMAQLAGPVRFTALDNASAARANVDIVVNQQYYSLSVSAPTVTELSTITATFTTSDPTSGSIYEIISNSSAVTLNPSNFSVTAQSGNYRFTPINITANPLSTFNGLCRTRYNSVPIGIGVPAMVSPTTVTISADSTNVNLRNVAVAQGWNQNSNSGLIFTVASGIAISSDSPLIPALVVDGAFPGGLHIINNGFIVGCGGTGGRGDSHNDNGNENNGTSGGDGGTAIKVVNVGQNIYITNNGVIAGGGGGGGGGRGGGIGGRPGGGGGGGGGRSGRVNSLGGQGGPSTWYPGSAGSGGTSLAAGAGGSAGYAPYSSNGGAGGDWGQPGAASPPSGNQAIFPGSGRPGGLGGYWIEGANRIYLIGGETANERGRKLPNVSVRDTTYNPRYFDSGSIVSQDVDPGTHPTDGFVTNYSGTYYSVQWVGYFVPAQTGDHVFHCQNVDDYFALWIGQNAETNYTINNAALFVYLNAALTSSQPIALQAGRRYAIRMQYTNEPSIQALQVAWSGPGQSMTTNFQNRVFHYSCTTATTLSTSVKLSVRRNGNTVDSDNITVTYGSALPAAPRITSFTVSTSQSEVQTGTSRRFFGLVPGTTINYTTTINTFNWTIINGVTSVKLEIISGPNTSNLIFPIAIYSANTTNQSGQFVYDYNSQLDTNGTYRVRLTAAGPGGFDSTLTGSSSSVADIDFVNKFTEVSTQTETTPPVVVDPYCNNLTFGSLEDNAGDLWSGFVFRNVIGVTRVIIKAKLSPLFYGDSAVNYDSSDNNTYGETVIHDTNWPNTFDSDGNPIIYSLPGSNTIRSVVNYHNLDNGNLLNWTVIWRIYVYTSAGLIFNSTKNSCPPDHIRPSRYNQGDQSGGPTE